MPAEDITLYEMDNPIRTTSRAFEVNGGSAVTTYQQDKHTVVAPAIQPK